MKTQHGLECIMKISGKQVYRVQLQVAFFRDHAAGMHPTPQAKACTYTSVHWAEP